MLKFDQIDSNTSDKLNKLFSPPDSFITINPGNIILPKDYLKFCNKIKNFKVYKDDIWIISYPRTGSTWAQEMIWLLGNNFNFMKSKNLQIIRSPLLEFSAVLTEVSGLSYNFNDSVEYAKQLPRPRYIKTHLPLHLLPSEIETVKPKIIYTARNLKDLAISYYHHLKLLHRMADDFETYCDLFLTENMPLGSPLDHMLAFWKKQQNDENILFLKYEDMNRDLVGAIKKAAKFLEITEDELTEERMNSTLNHLNFANMQKNPAVNLETLLKNQENNEKFIRKGKVGDWKNSMSVEMSDKFDELIKRKLEWTGLEFQYDL